MENRNGNLTFWSAGSECAVGEGVFGCASHGLCAKGIWIKPGEPGCGTWGTRLDGAVFSGSFSQVTASLRSLGDAPSLLLVFAAVGCGVESFLREVHGIFPSAAVAGGCAARLTERGELRPEAPEVVVLAVQSGSFEVAYHNVLDASLSLRFEASGVRTLRSLQTEPGGPMFPAVEAFSGLQRKHGKQPGDFESITLSDAHGRNLHFHTENGTLVSGADLPETGALVLRMASSDAVAERMESLMSVPGTLVLGCAGLRGTLTRPLLAAENSLGAFLFGEIGPRSGTPVFGNLMVATVRRLG